MAETSTLARPYAKAVFSLANETGQFLLWSDLLAALSAQVQRPAVASVLSHPSFKREDLAAYLIETCQLSPQPAALVQVLAANARLKLLPVIAQQYETLRQEAEAIAKVEVTSATVVAEAERASLSKAIAARLKRRVELSWSVDPALLGGAVLRSGDLLIDASFKGELARLGQALTR